MFLILACIVLASAYAYANDMSRHNRSVVVHRLFQNRSPKETTSARTPLNVTRIPQGYRQPGPAPAPAPRSLRH